VNAPAHAAEARRVSAIRMQLLDQHPFWGHLLLQAELIPMPGLPALAATDGHRRIWYDPERTRDLDLEELGFLLLHEIGHHVQESFSRASGRDPRLWNMATDYAINRVISKICAPGSWEPLYRMPKGGLLDKRFEGRIAETIYEVLAREAARGAGRGEEGPTFEVDGVVARGHGGHDVHVHAPLTDEEREALQDRVRAAVEHWQRAGQRGDLPGSAAALVQATPARIPWQRELQRFVDAARTFDELDVRRPSRRWLTQGAWVPSLGGERVGTIVVAVDSSGSIGKRELAAACGEVREIARQAADVRVLVADAKIQQVLTLDQIEPWIREGRVRGGGGTDHRPVFDWVRQAGLRPDVLIALTDLYTRLPDRAPPYPVVWVVPRWHGAAPWGRVIEVAEP
jgi:predicted metal-dependent peptidase